MVSLLSPFFFKETEKDQSTTSDVSHTTIENIDTQSSLTVFDDFNALESGEAREFIPYNYLLPSQEWSLCKVYRTNNVEFTMFLEPSNGTISGEKFMLTAKRVGDDFYISQYEGFASESEVGVIPMSRYCAILKSVQYHHTSSSKVRKWELLPASLGSMDNAPPLASISHSVLAQPGSGADIRMVDVSLPNYHINETTDDINSYTMNHNIINDIIDKNNCQRNMYVWDLNKKKTRSKFIDPYVYHDLANMKPNRLTSSTSTTSLSSSTSTSPTSSPTALTGRSKSSPTYCSNNSYEEDRLSVHIGSMIPMWDPSRNALLIKFMRNRVKLSSSKNFQFYNSNSVRSGKKWQNGSDVHISNAVVQFGKLEQNVYSLDFKNPVGPLHAFAMILSSFPEARYPQSSQ